MTSGRARSAAILLAWCAVCSAQTDKQPPALPQGVTVEANVAYGQHPQTVLDIFVPTAKVGQKRCGVLAIHGGGWVNGTKEAVVRRIVLPWLTHGCVVANVEYRLAAAAPAPAAVEDVLQAASWFRRNAKRWNVDDDRLIAVGTSAGGHLALMAGLTTKQAKLGPATKFAAVVNFYGITDVEDQLGGENARKYALTWVPEGPERMELARRVSPISYVRKDVPAVLTIHGTADTTVPYEHGVRITKALRDAGADAEMISVPEGKHALTEEQYSQAWEQIFAFLERRRLLGQH
ncbi:MAG TPA: alpha/beta hydrolase [Bryobacteraceae bacterium]|nr:alpha/beta hydrolase [Bryobacteraceae bacterium]